MESCAEENKISLRKETIWCVIHYRYTIVLFYLYAFRLMLAEIFDYCDGLAGEQVRTKSIAY